MKKLLIIILLFFIAISACSQNLNKSIYSGGMLFLQAGYTIAENRHQSINDFSFGIGGILKFYFCRYFTTGIYGGTQRTKYSSVNSENSNINLSYGGPFLGFSLKAGKFRYTLSAFVGKGTVKNLHIESQNNNMLTDAYLYKNSTMVFSPILSLDYAMSQRLLLTLQTVCLTTKFDVDKTLYNPTFQIGILFYR
jgi:hypothetical protein